MKKMKVLKFGGTSVGSAQRMKGVAELVVNDEPKIVVLSAMSGTTNTLVEIAGYYAKKNEDGAIEVIRTLEAKYAKVIDELYTKSDFKKRGLEVTKEHFVQLRSYVGKTFCDDFEKEILAQGELLSTKMFNLYLEEIGVKSALLPALDFMMIDQDDEPDAKYIAAAIAKVLEQYKGVDLFVTQGFITRNPQGGVDNLKRGGSDYSASLIGAAIMADEVQIWTDIDGVHNNDPRFVNKTYPLRKMSFDEAAELAYFGAKILHPASVLPAKINNIPVLLKNTMDPAAEGTCISNEVTGTGVKAVAAKDGIVSVKIKSGRMLLAYGFLRKVFEVFEKYKTPIDMITTSEVGVSVTIDNPKYLAEITEELKQFGSVTSAANQTIICVVGNMDPDQKGHSEEVLAALKGIPVSMISYGGSNYNISLLIDTPNKQKALQLLNENLFKL